MATAAYPLLESRETGHRVLGQALLQVDVMSETSPARPDFSIVFVCHGGAIETKACLLAASLRTQLGDDVPLVAAVPAECEPLSAEAENLLDALQVRREPTHSPFGQDYLIGNKLTA